MSITYLIQFFIILGLFTTIFLKVNYNNNIFSDWKYIWKRINKNYKPIKINNIFSISLNIKNFENYKTWIKLRIETKQKNKIVLLNIFDNNWNYIFKKLNNWYLSNEISFDKYNINNWNWDINIWYIITNLYNNWNKYIKELYIKNISVDTWEIIITADYPFSIILNNYKYLTKQDARWNYKYNQNQVIIKSNFFINKVN